MIAFATANSLAMETSSAASDARSPANDNRFSIVSFDATGERTKLTWPDAYAINYTYDSLGRMTWVTDSTTTLATYAYDALGRRTQIGYNNGTAAVAYTYTNANDVLTLADSMTASGNNVTYTDTYTNAHQLLSEATSNTSYNWQPSAASTNTYAAVNVLNQYPSVNSVAISYDTKGNLTSDGTWTYAYDAENRLMTANKTGSANSYAYDPFGRRTTKTASGVVTYYLHDGDTEIAEYNGSGTLQRRFVPGPAIDEYIEKVEYPAKTKTFFHVNRQDSVVAMSDINGALSEGPYTYDAYGNTTATSGEPFKYTGQRLDPEIGCYYYRARIYCPAIGRFLQPDGVGYSAGMDVYTYTGDDPTDKADPMGLYNCKGSDSQCQNVNRAVGKAWTAYGRMDHRGAMAKRLYSILKTLGSKDDSNRVNVQFGDSHGDTSTNSQGVSTITLSNDFGNHPGGGRNDAMSEATGVLVHEGSHATDQQAGGMPKNEQQVWDTEAMAYSVQARTEIALGNYSSYGGAKANNWTGWHPGMSEDDIRAGIYEQTMLSVAADCTPDICHGRATFQDRLP